MTPHHDREVEEWHKIITLSHRPEAVDPFFGHILYFPPSRPIQPRPLSHRPLSYGRFSTLPLELLHQILSSVDLHTLGSIRLSNYAFRGIVDSSPEIRDLVENAEQVSPLLRALRETSTDKRPTLHNFHSELTSETCFWCGDHGQFLFLLRCRRACFNCLCRSKELRLIPLGDERMLKQFCIPKSKTKHLPCLTYPKSLYSRMQRRVSGELKLYLSSDVERIALASYGGDRAKWYADIEKKRELRRQKARMKSIDFDEPNPIFAIEPERNPAFTFESQRSNVNPRYGLPIGISAFGYKCRKYVGAVLFPTINPKERDAFDRVRNGLWCRGCNDAALRWFQIERNVPTIGLGEEDEGWVAGWAGLEPLERSMLRTWSKEGFLVHVKSCERARRIWDKMRSARDPL